MVVEHKEKKGGHSFDNNCGGIIRSLPKSQQKKKKRLRRRRGCLDLRLSRSAELFPGSKTAHDFSLKARPIHPSNRNGM